MKSLQPTEKEIQDNIIEYLRRKKWYVQRLNSGVYRLEKSLVRGVAAGTPDVMAFKRWGYGDNAHVHLLFVEVKRPGKKATPLQLSKMSELARYGAKCLVATCIEDLQKEGI